MELEGSLPSSQELSTRTYPEPDQSSPKHSLLFLLLVIAKFPGSPILVTLMMEKVRSSERWFL
jgi:hypothetical protein